MAAVFALLAPGLPVKDCLMQSVMSHAMPLFSIWFCIFTLCNMAMPLTPSFVGEFLSLCGIVAHKIVFL
jgi:NADH:ubiquinone oxidoreductase subunit 4 (subunit M)